MRSKLLLLLPVPLTLAANSLNNFDFYPKGTQPCLYEAATSANCTGTTVAELNTCQCGNEGDFIISAAKCVGEKDEGDVQSLYDTMSTACRDSGTPMGVSEKQFKDAAAGKAATGTATATATGTKGSASATNTAAVTTTTKGGQTITVTPTPTGGSDKGGLSTGAMIGIGVGAAVLGSLALLGVVYLLIRRRRRRTGEEAHPMLPPQNSNPYGPTAFASTNPSETKPAWAQSSPDPQKPWSADSYGQAPPYSVGGYTAPGGGFTAAGGLPVQQHQHQQQQHQRPQQPGVFEMEGTEVTEAVEMPGTIPGQQQQHHGGWPR